MLRAIDTRDFNSFGLRILVALELDGLLDLPAIHTRAGSDNPGFESRLTAISYAAWRRRHGAIKQLLVAGANPAVSQRAPLGALHASPADAEALMLLLSRRNGRGVNSSTACHVVECVTRMRVVAARDVALGASFPPCSCCGVTGLSVSFDPCGCIVCEACVWRSVLHHGGGAEWVRGANLPQHADADGGDGGAASSDGQDAEGESIKNHSLSGDEPTVGSDEIRRGRARSDEIGIGRR